MKTDEEAATGGFNAQHPPPCHTHAIRDKNKDKNKKINEQNSKAPSPPGC